MMIFDGEATIIHVDDRVMSALSCSWPPRSARRNKGGKKTQQGLLILPES